MDIPTTVSVGPIATSQDAKGSVPVSVGSSTDTQNTSCLQWVDYLPGQLPPNAVIMKQRSSMDPSETNMTETNSVSCQDDKDDDEMDVEDWPDSGSLEGYSMMPHYLLVEGDPLVQHELALHHHRVNAANSQNGGGCNCSISIAASEQDPSVAPELFANSLEELMEQRRMQLASMMQASMRTRQCLEPHIRQRAGLSNVLSQIERSSWTIQEHLLAGQQQASSAAATLSEDEVLPPPPETEIPTKSTMPVIADNHSVATASADTCNSVDMTGVGVGLDDGSVDVEDFAAAVLNDPDDCML